MRNKDYKKTKKRVKRQTNGDGGVMKEQKEMQRIKSYDYQAWDKFDVVIRLCILIHALVCIKM